jgi:hypothetical protein
MIQTTNQSGMGENVRAARVKNINHHILEDPLVVPFLVTRT